MQECKMQIFKKSLSVWPWKALTNDTFLCSSKYRIDLHKNIAFIAGAINDIYPQNVAVFCKNLVVFGFWGLATLPVNLLKQENK